MISPIEETRNYLARMLNIPCNVSVPDERPDAFAIVYVSNPGSAPPPLQTPTLGVQVWARTKASADAYIRDAYETLADNDADANVIFSPIGTYFQPYPFDGQHHTMEFRCIVSAI